MSTRNFTDDEKIFAANLGVRIKAWRTAMKLSMSAFGNKIGVDKVTISRWESGKRVPSLYCYRRMRRLVRSKEVDA